MLDANSVMKRICLCWLSFECSSDYSCSLAWALITNLIMLGTVASLYSVTFNTSYFNNIPGLSRMLARDWAVRDLLSIQRHWTVIVVCRCHVWHQAVIDVHSQCFYGSLVLRMVWMAVKRARRVSTELSDEPFRKLCRNETTKVMQYTALIKAINDGP